MGHVIIGMDPHKRSATIEVIDNRERVLAQGRHRPRRLQGDAGRRPRGFLDRVWAVEDAAALAACYERRFPHCVKSALGGRGYPMVRLAATLPPAPRSFSGGTDQDEPGVLTDRPGRDMINKSGLAAEVLRM